MGYIYKNKKKIYSYRIDSDEIFYDILCWWIWGGKVGTVGSGYDPYPFNDPNFIRPINRYVNNNFKVFHCPSDKGRPNHP